MSDNYWDGWYASGAGQTIPSQFAVMVATELVNEVDRIVDFGCGNGRDTGLLSALAPTVGVDTSPKAIEIARARAPEAEFRVGSVEQVDGEGLLYARFLLHAIPEQVEDELLDRLVGYWTVAFEFRTPEDAVLPKATPDHFRRGVDVDDLCAKLEQREFHIRYAVEGRGMAKFGPDDAHVGRVIAERL